MPLERSCGAVVFTREGGEIRYVVVTEKGGAHSFPKGHMEGGETEEETAAREVFEETGLRPRFIPGFRQKDEYPLPAQPGVRKRVVYFLAEYRNQALTPRPGEIREVRVLPFKEALSCFEHESTRRVLRAARAFAEKTRPEEG